MTPQETLKALPESGTYAITISPSEAYRATVGSVGDVTFERGFYLYVGSARRNLRHRVARHLAQSKKVRWHVDYLTANPKNAVTEVAAWRHCSECEVAKVLKKGSDGWIDGFGSSDCRCGSHLVYFATAERRSRALQLALPDVSVAVSARPRWV
jgi:Uri superfamily endonuclease